MKIKLFDNCQKIVMCGMYENDNSVEHYFSMYLEL